MTINWQRSGVGPPGSEAVLADLRRQLAANPGDLVAMHNCAVELRMLGRLDEALDMARAAWRAGLHIPETATTSGHNLVDLGRFTEAAEAFRQALSIDPTHTSAHEALATLLPQIGGAEQAFDSYHQALARAPDSVPLWASALATANGQRRYGQLLDLSEAALRRFGADPVLRVYKACALAGLGEATAARELASAVVLAQPDYVLAQLVLARILLRQGDPSGAETAAARATRLAPQDQLGWTLLGTAWRLLDDPREAWLCRYDELVMPLDIALPTGLEAALTARHRAGLNPAEQTLRGGTQTPGSLFHSPDPVILDLARTIHAAIEAHLATVRREAGHPFLARNTGAIAFSSSWSVRLADQGFHVGHMHAAGWLSSALYVALPDSIGAGSGEGVLTFGVPDAELGLDLSPRRIVEPRVGRLVLFPSYLWHGTTPFHSPQPRLTVAFDALPVDNASAPL